MFFKIKYTEPDGGIVTLEVASYQRWMAEQHYLGICGIDFKASTVIRMVSK